MSAARPDLRFERAIELAAELIRIPSLPGEEGAVAARIVDELDRLGFQDVGTDQAGNVVGCIRGTRGAPGVMLSSHMDVVDAGDPCAWEFDPWGGEVAGGCLHGRGAMDLKGPLALQVYAAARFAAARLPGDLRVVFSVYEEKGGWGMMHWMERCAVPPGAVILGEATGGDLCTGHRGHAELAVEIRGRAAHASAPERGRSPSLVLPAVLEALHELSREQPADPVLGCATLTPTVIESWPKSGNVIPDRVRITLDLRVLPAWDETAALGEIRAALAARVPPVEGISVHVLPGRAVFRAWTGYVEENSNFTPSFLVPADHPVVAAAAAALRQATSAAPAVRQWSFGTDGGHACGTHGIPAIGYAPGDEALAHTCRERLELSSARTAFDAYPPLIRAVQDAVLNAGSALAVRFGALVPSSAPRARRRKPTPLIEGRQP